MYLRVPTSDARLLERCFRPAKLPQRWLKMMMTGTGELVCVPLSGTYTYMSMHVLVCVPVRYLNNVSFQMCDII